MNIIGLPILKRQEGLVTTRTPDMWTMRGSRIEMMPFIMGSREELTGMQMRVRYHLERRKK